MDVARILEEAPRGWTLMQEGAGEGHAHYDSKNGQVDLVYYVLLPGVLMTNIDLACSELPMFNPAGPQLATVNWCASGRCEVDFGTHGSLVVGSQTLCLSSALARSFAYPTGSYRGFEYFIDFGQLDAEALVTLASFGLTEEVLRCALVPQGLGVTLAPSEELLAAIRAIESELAREHPRRPWLLLATFRLMLLLASEDRGGSAIPQSYLRRSQRDIAQAVYQQLVESGSPVAHLGPLAAHLGLSEASLRAYFFRVYGQSPAAFARAHALDRAARLLVETDLPVADVSQACGYANPSKFSAAFRRTYDANPLEYRRRSRLG